MTTPNTFNPDAPHEVAFRDQAAALVEQWRMEQPGQTPASEAA